MFIAKIFAIATKNQYSGRESITKALEQQPYRLIVYNANTVNKSIVNIFYVSEGSF